MGGSPGRDSSSQLLSVSPPVSVHLVFGDTVKATRSTPMPFFLRELVKDASYRGGALTRLELRLLPRVK